MDRELERMTVRETDVDAMLEEQIIDLKNLLNAYRDGRIAVKISDRNSSKF